MSLVAKMFDEILDEFQRSNRISLEGIIRNMEPAFQVEGFRPQAEEKVQRIIVVRLDEIGDCVLTSPFLRELRRAYPQVQIDFLVKKGVYSLMEFCPHVNHVMIAEGLPPSGSTIDAYFSWIRQFCERLWPQHYDLCIVPRWDIDETYTLMLAYFCGAWKRVGFGENCYPLKAVQDAGMNNFLTRPVLTPVHVVHEVEKSLFLLRAGLGIHPMSAKLELWLTKSDADAVQSRLQAAGILRPYIAVAVGTREARKTYPAKMLVKALLGLPSDVPFVLLGGLGEEAAGRTVAEALQEAGRQVLDLVGQTPLRQSAALVAMARLYMGGDTGLTHIAAAAKRPIVEWFCHPKSAPISVLSLLARFSPWQARAVLIQPDHAAHGCETMTAGFHEIAGCNSRDATHCIKNIPPEQITAAANRLLARR